MKYDGFIEAAKFRMKRYISWGKNVFYWMKRTKIVKRMAKWLLERGMIDTCEKEYDGKKKDSNAFNCSHRAIYDHKN